MLLMIRLTLELLVGILDLTAERPPAGRPGWRRWTLRPPSPFKPERIQKTLRQLAKLLLEMADGITVEAEKAEEPAGPAEESPPW